MRSAGCADNKRVAQEFILPVFQQPLRVVLDDLAERSSAVMNGRRFGHERRREFARVFAVGAML
jgi:hypothetical protein